MQTPNDAPGVKTIKGLLIEDDPNDALLFMNDMKRGHWPSRHFVFEHAATLRLGLEALSKGGIEVVALDVHLPDSRGIETVSKLCSRFPDVPVVVLTGLPDEAVGMEALRIGAQDYQVKGSLDARALQRTISYAVERHRMLARMETIIAKSEDGMVVVDAGGRVLHMNPAAEELFGLEARELLGKPFPQETSTERSAEIRIPAEGGRERIAEMRVSEIEWDEKPARLALIRDITELRKLESLKAEVKQRRELAALKDEFIGTVSHELRTPLALVMTAVDSLRKGLAGELSAKQRDVAELCHRNILRLSRMINNLLDISRLESGSAKSRMERLDLKAFLDDLEANYRMMGRITNIKLEILAPADLPEVRADPEMLMQVLDILLDNAERFAVSEIRVRASRNDGGVRLEVADDGPGIPPDRIGLLFNKFSQVARSVGGGYKGTGLGLAICKEILALHGATIAVDSPPGGGARFYFVLPEWENQAVAAKRSAAKQGRF